MFRAKTMNFPRNFRLEVRLILPSLCLVLVFGREKLGIFLGIFGDFSFFENSFLSHTLGLEKFFAFYFYFLFYSI